MKFTFLIIFFQIFNFGASAQRYFYSDLGNSVLLRPNLGFEHRFKKHSINGAIQWQRNGMMWLYEFPSVKKVTKGLRLEMGHKYHLSSHFFFESRLRFQTYKGPDILSAWQGMSLYNSRNFIELSEKLGMRIYPSKRIHSEFSAGVGLNYGSSSLSVGDESINQGNLFERLSDEEILKKYPNPRNTIFQYTPQFQFRFFYRIDK